MVRTWMTKINPLYERTRYQMYYEQVPVFRQVKADRIRFQQDKARSVGAWILYQSIRKKYNLSEEAVFNLSHSGDYVLCSIQVDSRKVAQIGCDIEEIKQANLKVAKRFFHATEYAQIENAKDEVQQKEVFYRYWVLKESFMKATRQGMALDMKSFEIQLSNPPKIIKKPCQFTEIYYYQEYAIANIPYKMAVCSTDEQIDPEIRMEFTL